jgi:hypothetical protein
VPTFFVDAQMFWGNDRLVILKHLLKTRGSRSPEHRPHPTLSPPSTGSG